MGSVSPLHPALLWTEPNAALAGLRDDTAARLVTEAGRGEFRNLHGLIIVRGGNLGLETYFTGDDQQFGQSLGIVPHGANILHDVRSITKSIVSLLYGIALAGKLVPPATARLFDHYPALLDDPKKRRITIAHALSMRLGLAWNEGLDYDNPANSEIEMESAPDRIAYVLNRPLADMPGRRWVYSGGSTALLGDLIARGAGMDLEAYARQALFGPMGIANVEWVRGSGAVPVASSGLRMEPRDIARVGQMVLDKGRWNGRRIVPAGWLATSFKPRAFVETGLRYGYQWWLGSLAATGKPWYAAFGNGGQRLFVVPSLDLVVVILAGNYNDKDQWKMPARLMQRIVIPSLAEPRSARPAAGQRNG